MTQIPSGSQTPSFSGGAAASGVEYGAAAEQPVGSSAVDSGQTDLPEYTQAGDNPQIGSETSNAPAGQQQQQQQQPNAVQQELQSLSNAFGQDFTGFTSVADARNAARIIAEGYAQRGLQNGGWGVQPQQQQQQFQQPNTNSVFDIGPPQQQQQFQQPNQFQIPGSQQAAIPELDIDLGDLSELDPKVKAGIEKIKQVAQQALQQSQQLVQGVQNQFKQSQKQQVRDRAHAALDASNNPRYGAGQAKNSMQIINRQNVERLVNSIVDGMVFSGTQVPPIEQVVEMAVMIDNGFAVPQNGQQQQQQQQPGVHAMKPTSQSAGPRTINLTPKRAVNPNYDPLGLLNDDDFRRGLQEIAAKY